MKSANLLILLIIALVSGCAGSPNIYTSTLSVTSGINYRESQDIIKSALVETFPNEHVDENCLIYRPEHGNKNLEFAKVCYYVSGSIVRRTPSIKLDHPAVHDWFEQLSAKQSIFEHNYMNLANSYIDKQQADLPDFNAKVNNIQKKCIDETQSLPTDTVELLCDQIKIIEIYPNIITKYPKNTGKYILKTVTNADKSAYFRNYPDLLVTRITGYKIVPIPELDSAEDEILSFKAYYMDIYESSYGKLNKIEISNKSKDYISIDSISGYYKGQVVTNILRDSITLPPMAKVSIDVNHLNTFPSQSKPQQFVNYGEKAEYGFSIRYKQDASQSIKTLFKVNEFTVK